jgi:hypothetical protein
VSKFNKPLKFNTGLSENKLLPKQNSLKLTKPRIKFESMNESLLLFKYNIKQLANLYYEIHFYQ